MICFCKNRYLVGLCVLAAGLLAATGAGSIGKADKPRPTDEPLAMGEPPPQGEVVEEGAKGGESGAEKGRSRIGARPTAPAELIAADERKHLKRMAGVNRIQVLGIDTLNQGLVDLARELRDKETRRHELALRRLERTLPVGGGR